jgi:hypothetical protein
MESNFLSISRIFPRDTTDLRLPLVEDGKKYIKKWAHPCVKYCTLPVYNTLGINSSFLYAEAFLKRKVNK